QQVGGQQRLFIKDTQYFLDFPRRRGGAEADAIADRRLLTLAEGGQHALTDGKHVLQLVRHGVGVRLVERAVEDHVGEQAGRLRGRGQHFAEEVALHGNGHDRPLDRNNFRCSKLYYKVKGRYYASMLPRELFAVAGGQKAVTGSS